MWGIVGPLATGLLSAPREATAAAAFGLDVSAGVGREQQQQQQQPQPSSPAADTRARPRYAHDDFTVFAAAGRYVYAIDLRRADVVDRVCVTHTHLKCGPAGDDVNQLAVRHDHLKVRGVHER